MLPVGLMIARRLLFSRTTTGKPPVASRFQIKLLEDGYYSKGFARWAGKKIFASPAEAAAAVKNPRIGFRIEPV